MPPIRSCIACRRKASPAELLRLVADPGGVVHPDLSGRLPGRGAWIHPDLDCLDTLSRRPAMLSRALRVDVVFDGLGDRLRDAVVGRMHHLLSLAARAGCVVSGHDVLMQQLARGELLVLLAASDASERSIAALEAAAPSIPCHPLSLDREALGRRVGKGPRAALGIRRGAPSKALLDELRRCASLGYHRPRNRSGDRPEATRQPGTTRSRGHGLGSPPSPESPRRKRGQPSGARLREGSVCPRKRS